MQNIYEWMNEFIIVSPKRNITFYKAALWKKNKNEKSDWCKKLLKKFTIYKILDILVKDGI